MVVHFDDEAAWGELRCGVGSSQSVNRAVMNGTQHAIHIHHNVCVEMKTRRTVVKHTLCRVDKLVAKRRYAAGVE